MAAEDEHDDPVERLLDVFVYAPIGMLATAGEDLDVYVRKGRERAVAARMIGEFTLKGVDDRVTRSFADLESMAREFLRVVAANASPSYRRGASERTTDGGGDAASGGSGRSSGIDDLIADYDTMTAREVLQRLGDLDDGSLARVEAHESSNRNRSTVLARIRRLRA